MLTNDENVRHDGNLVMKIDFHDDSNSHRDTIYDDGDKEVMEIFLNDDIRKGGNDRFD